eukprot:8353208-Karenia_brevis.AAC.1
MTDLGSAISSTYVCNTSISRGRLRKAVNTLARIAQLPHGQHAKGSFILACAHASALYGCEASHVDESALRMYTA